MAQTLKLRGTGNSTEMPGKFAITKEKMID